MAFNFKPLARGVKGPDTRSPYIRISTQGVIFPHEAVLSKLGNPSYVLLEVDPEQKALRILKNDGGTYGARAIRQPGESKRSGRSPYINITPLHRLLPIGVYKPIGGGVFQFDRPNLSNVKG